MLLTKGPTLWAVLSAAEKTDGVHVDHRLAHYSLHFLEREKKKSNEKSNFNLTFEES